MASLKAIRKRVTSVKNTQQITKAMKMVSAAKLRRAQEAATAARPYAEKIEALTRGVAARAGKGAHPLLHVPAAERQIDLLLVTGDRGLCGGYNAGLIRKAEGFLAARGRENVRLTAVGRRGFDYFRRRGVAIADKHINLFGGPNRALAESLARRFAGEFASHHTDAIYLLFSEFRSTLSQVPALQRLLPIAAELEAPPAPGLDYLFEPEPAAVLGKLLERYVSVQVQRAFLESVASEHAARMTAMDNATSNAAEMIDRLTLQMNRARQAAITKELMEIVSGAEALRG